jgi:hypothetical protein
MANSPRDVSRSQMGRGRRTAQRGGDGFLRSIGSSVRCLSKREQERDRESTVGLLHLEAKLGNDSCWVQGARRIPKESGAATNSIPNRVRLQHGSGREMTLLSRPDVSVSEGAGPTWQRQRAGRERSWLLGRLLGPARATGPAELAGLQRTVARRERELGSEMELGRGSCRLEQAKSRE